MPTVSPENNKFIYSRIVFELADAIKAAENKKLHIDDALIVAATPAVLLNYKEIEERELKRITVSLKRFFQRNPRFLDFKKSAVAKGLRLEWLPTLEDHDKVTMLSDFTLTPAVSEDGYVIFNPTVFANLTRREHPDRETYGKSDYVARPARKSAAKRDKVLLSDIAPDAKLSELAKRVKELVELQATVADWNNRDDIKAELKMDIIIVLATAGYPPKIHDEVFKSILEQAENFKRHAPSFVYSTDEYDDTISIAAEP